MSKKKPKEWKIGKTTAKNAFEYATYLSLIEKLGKSGAVEYEPERFTYTTEHTYRPDFIIRTRTGKTLIIETKGGGRAWTHEVRTKMASVRDQHPGLDIRILFYSDGQFGPKRKNGTRQRQSDWAIKNGFKFAIRHVPDDWLNE